MTVAIVCYCPTCDYFVKVAVQPDAIGTHGCAQCNGPMEVYIAEGAAFVVHWHKVQDGGSVRARTLRRMEELGIPQGTDDPTLLALGAKPLPVPGVPLERISQANTDHKQPGEGMPGDCLRAAVASLLGMGRLDVPHFAAIDFGVEEGDVPEGGNRRHAWWWAMLGWAASLQPSFDVIPCHGDRWPDPDRTDDPLKGCYILSGRSPRGPWNHSVVARAGEVVWDPHPSREGILGRVQADVWVLRSAAIPTPEQAAPCGHNGGSLSSEVSDGQ